MIHFRLKSGLIALGLKCGGTLQVICHIGKKLNEFNVYNQERAERLFETKGKNLSELPKDMFAKQKPGKGKNEKTEKLKEIARMEAQIYRFAELLKEIRDDTVENVERKQVRETTPSIPPILISSTLRPEQMLRGRNQRVRCLRKRWRRRAMMIFPTTPRTCPWDGMVSSTSIIYPT